MFIVSDKTAVAESNRQNQTPTSTEGQPVGGPLAMPVVASPQNFRRNKMQSIQEMTETWVALGTKKGLKLPTRTNESEEIFLSKIKLICESSGVKPEVKRNNGGRQTITETNTATRDQRIVHFMEGSRLSYREACYMIGERPDRDAKQPASITESLIAKWKKYAPWISEKDARTLAEMGKLP
jgi:hypothetical protein